MAEKKERGRFTIMLNERDPAHEAAIRLLESQPPRGKAQFIVNALLHYMSCPSTTDGTSPLMNRSAIEKIVQEVLLQQKMDKLPDAARIKEPSQLSRQTDPEAQRKGEIPIADTETNNGTFSLVADALSAFRGG